MKERREETTQDNNPGQNRPAQEFRLGSIRAAIWQRQGVHGPLFHITVSRLYRDRDDRWASSSSFGREDVPLLVKVLEDAHTWTYLQSGKGSEGSAEESEG